MAQRLLRYNVLLHVRHNLPVMSVLILLRLQADEPGLTGRLAYQAPDGTTSISFHYRVVRLWQEPVTHFLSGGLGTLPLAPLSEVSPQNLPEVIRRMKERLSAEIEPEVSATLWASTYILMGLLYPPEAVAGLLKGVMDLEESMTYQAILAEGEKRLLLRVGEKRFGIPTPQTRRILERIQTPAQVERLTDRLLEAESWEELLTSL